MGPKVFVPFGTPYLGFEKVELRTQGRSEIFVQKKTVKRGSASLYDIVIRDDVQDDGGNRWVELIPKDDDYPKLRWFATGMKVEQIEEYCEKAFAALENIPLPDVMDSFVNPNCPFCKPGSPCPDHFMEDCKNDQREPTKEELIQLAEFEDRLREQEQHSNCGNAPCPDCQRGEKDAHKA